MTKPQPIVILGCRVISCSAGLSDNQADPASASNNPPRAATRDPSTSLAGALGRRVRAAAEVFEAQAAGDLTSGPWVFVSGGKRWAGVSEARAMFHELTRLGVPATRIVEEASSMSTRENAAQIASLLRSRRVREISLVTCDFHMLRASRLFRSYDLHVDEVPAATPRSGLVRQTLRGLVQRASEHPKGWLDGWQRASVLARSNSRQR